ncbi:MAG: hypothetical protein IPL65_12860 [Lewinellaceae bacterium]|nr:hypothetical protein [Lewinellaceae bacterium]
MHHVSFFVECYSKTVPTRWLDRYHKYRYAKAIPFSRQLHTKAVFEKIYRSKHWDEGESISGPGSSLMATQGIVAGLQKFVADYHIASMVDVPCGDFHWMRQLNFSNLKYLGRHSISVDPTEHQAIQQRKRTLQDLNIISDEISFCVMFCSTGLPGSIFLWGHHGTIENIKKSPANT